MKSTPFWADNFDVLFQNDYISEFWITKSQTIEESLNAVVRFSIYATVVLALHFRDIGYFKFIVLAMIITYVLYTNRSKGTDFKKLLSPQKVETFGETSENCVAPTKDNPFMNFTMGDYMNIDKKTRSVVPKVHNSDCTYIEKNRDTYFSNNLYKDVNDVFGKMNSQRQFFTMPWTGIIPDEAGDFKNWLYKTDRTCKESGDCLRYEDLRAKAPVFPDPTKNPTRTS
ncbi:hypothetical protein EB118_03090 [bacterium]|nr:hypothetical protein [bacterium]NDC93950.1 hypothetical protein [bacterium]NDD83445.1 hypothetical protein [bacterium]NDG29070.1 hypothetical protein [bacterium]